MNNTNDYQYFLIIKKRKFLFQTFNPINGSSLIKEILVENYSEDDFYYSIERFLEKNIFKIEKELNSFIKKISIIFESDSFFEVGSSIKHNLKGINFKFAQLNDTLIDIKNQFEKYSQNHEIIHMIINSYIINGIVHKILPENINADNLVVEVNFICLENKIVENLKKIFSKYEISINKILCHEYLKRLDNLSSENITKIANDSINGYNVNEVFIVKKTFKKQGFFEKFFNFFN
jgi:hypothetical protein